MDKKESEKRSKLKTFLEILGPGLITGASDDDPSGIATYSQAGAQFGLLTLWTALITLPLMISIQEMCARIGLVTSKGLITNIKDHYPKMIVYLTLIVSFPAIILNIGADIAGMGAVANLLVKSIPAEVFSIIFTLISIVSIVFLPYKKVTTVLKYLCLSLLLYLIVPFLVTQDWLAVLKNTFIPTIKLNKEFIGILVAILGTTISPYLFFWQATMEAEEKKQTTKKIMNRRSLNEMSIDVIFGMLASNLVMYFIILTTGSILFKNGINHIDTVEQAAKALEPLAGKFSYLLFALGVIGTGFLAIPVLSSCLSYILCSTFDWQEGLNKKYYQAKTFYGVIVVSLLLGLVINFIGISPIKALIYSAMLYGITAPVFILIILFIANNKKIMNKHTNGIWSNLFGILTFLFMTLAAVILVISWFYP